MVIITTFDWFGTMVPPRSLEYKSSHYSVSIKGVPSICRIGGDRSLPLEVVPFLALVKELSHLLAGCPPCDP